MTASVCKVVAPSALLSVFPSQYTAFIPALLSISTAFEAWEPSVSLGVYANKVFFIVGHKLQGQEKYLVESNTSFDIYSIVPSLISKKHANKLNEHNIKGFRISTEAQDMGIYKSFNYEVFERRNCVLFAFDGNSSVANLVQEARNGKGNTRIFIYPKSKMLKDKANSLEGYVTINPTIDEVLNKIYKFEDNIGTRKND